MNCFTSPKIYKLLKLKYIHTSELCVDSQQLRISVNILIDLSMSENGVVGYYLQSLVVKLVLVHI